jgi:tripartite-type tricarboxylate transporter receptor subunit TctC
MRIPRRRFLHLAAGAVALTAVQRIARAQTFPTRPITLIVPFPAGGGTDTVARIIAEPMRASLGRPIIIENVSGANGSIGVGRAARAAPDGYTLSFGQWGTHVANGVAYALDYDLVRDFEPISLIANGPFLIVARKSIPANDLKGLLSWLKANPGKVTAGHDGVGSLEQVGAVMFQNSTGTSLQLVPYRGSAAALQDLVAGQIDMMIEGAIVALPQVRAGAIKAFALTAKSRLAAAPDIATVDEAGLPGFYLSVWDALFAPKGTPKEVVAKLSAAVAQALADLNVHRRLADLGREIYPREQQTPEALAAFQKAEIDKWWPIMKAAGVKPE